MNNYQRTILIVDDSPHNIELISELFKNSYNILTAQSGKEALKVMGENDSIDAVLLDILMPEMDGYQVLEIMQKDERLKFIPVIVITSDRDTEAEYKAFELGAVDFICRPFNIKTVEKRVNSVIRQLELDNVRAENLKLKSEAKSERHLSALMGNLPGGVAIIETDGHTAECTYYNKSVPKLFGMSDDEFIKEFKKSKKPQWLKDFMNKAKDGSRISYDFSIEVDSAQDKSDDSKERKSSDKNKAADKNTKPQNRTQWVRVIASGLGENNGKCDMYCVFLDINEEKIQELKAAEAKEKLRSNEVRMESMINNAPGGIALCEQDLNGDLQVLYCSRGLAAMMGCSDYNRYLTELVENPASRLKNKEDIKSFKKEFDACALTSGSVEHMFRCKDYKGNLLWVMLRGQVMKGDDGVLTLYAFVNDITKEKEYEQELKTSAYYDPLTGLYNRSAFFINAKRLIDNNPQVQYAVMRFNVGGFKLINDIMGRETGDRVLNIVAETIRAIAPANSVYARFHADNFAIIVPWGELTAETLINSVKDKIKNSRIISHDVQYYVGIYLITDKETKIEDVCDRALMACRSITGSFNRHVAFYDDRMRLQMLEEQEICDEAHRAVANHEFCIYYQSVYGIRDKRFVSAEALVRWKHPTKGLIPPGKFIPVFEKNGFIAELDLYILEQVCIYQQKRSKLGLPQFPISVNISRMSLYNPKLYDIISNLTDKYGVSPSCFRIEVTETAYNDNPAQLLDTIKKLRDKCYPILMDDFGSGYSSLNTLKDIPIDILKLDMKFMEGFEKNERVGTIVTSVARMSKWLNVPMLAEGVETKEQYEFLASIGCAYIQGYYFAKPVCEEEFTKIIAAENVTPLDNKMERYKIGEEVYEILGSNALVSKLISGVFGGLGIYELNGGKLEVIRVNEGYMQIMGYTPSDFSGEHFDIWEKLKTEDVEISKNACLEAARTDKAVRAVVRRYDKNGKMLYLDGIHRKLGGTEDSPIFCIAFNDITDQIESDRIIRQSKDQISNILDATGAVAVDVDFVGNGSICAGDTDEYDFDADELAEMIKSKDGLESIVHPDDVERLKRFRRSTRTERTSVELRIKNTRGGYTWCRVTKTQAFDENKNRTRLIGIINNIDAEKKAAQELAHTQERVDITMNSINAGVLIADISKNFHTEIIYSNDGFWKLIGERFGTGGDLVKHIKSLLTPDDVLSVKKKILSGETVHFQCCNLNENGSETWVEYNLVPTKSYDEEKHRYLVLLDDITEQHRTVYQINQLVSNFDGGLALIAKTDSDITLPYANNTFFKVLNTKGKNDPKLEKILKNFLENQEDNLDLSIMQVDGSESVVKIHLTEIDSGKKQEKNYIVVAQDVTLKRAEAKSRIAERKANALRGLYDEVFKVDYRNRSSLLVSCRSNPQKAKNARPVSLDYIINDWTEKFIHPDDKERARKLFNAPAGNPDFTDAYDEIRLAVPRTEGQYVKFGMVMVRSAANVCMLFYRNMDRIDSSTTSEEVAELNRLYRTVAEQTNTTVIELDHITGKVTVSPSIYMYAAGMLSESMFGEKENYVKGLAIHPMDREIFTKFLEDLNNSDNSNGSSSVVLRMEMADKTYKWCRLSISLTRSNTGEVLKSLCTINMVNDEVEARRKAENMDGLIRRTVKNIPVGVGIYKLDNGFPVPVYASDNIYTIFGISKDRPILDKSIAEEFIANNKLEAGQEGEYTQYCTKPNGSKFWLRTKYSVRKEEDQTVIYAAIDDISNQIEAQRNQKVQEQMYQILLEETGTIIFHYDNDTDELYYFRPNGIEKRPTLISQYSENSDKFAILNSSDRESFAALIEKLSKSPSASAELIVTINVDGYPRRFRCFFKSMNDPFGNVFRIIGKIEDVDDEMNHLDKIKAKAMYDSLCVDIYNKATTEELIRAELEHTTGGALIMIDVDDFKSINDILGHIFGDEFLKKFATTIKSVFRDSDIVGRYGGDEFFIFISHANASLAVKKGQQILENISKIQIPKIGSVKSSIGIASVNPDNRDYRQLLRQADSALYSAKNKGKNRVVLFDPNSMSEGNYRTEEAVSQGRTSPVILSSNPNSSASIILRIFSALYSSYDLSTGINQMLALAGKTYDVSRAYIFEDTEDGLYCCNTFEWCNEGVEPEIESLQQVSYEEDLGGNYRENMNDDGIFYCHDIKTLNTPQREILERQGIKSVLQSAIMDKGEFKGFVGFDECRSNRFWTQEQIDGLAFISKIISIFILKDRSTRMTECYAKSIKSIFDNYPQYVYLVEKENMKILYANNKAKDVLKLDVIGMKCYDAICGNKDLEGCPIKALIESGRSKTMKLISPVLKKPIRAIACEVEWEGKPAYLVSCMMLNDDETC